VRACAFLAPRSLARRVSSRAQPPKILESSIDAMLYHARDNGCAARWLRSVRSSRLFLTVGFAF
jgi:hypothetical protein